MRPSWILAIVCSVSLALALVTVQGGAKSIRMCRRDRPDFGSFVYLYYPDVLMRAIRVAEGVPSYGVMWLADKYGGHERVPLPEGRRAAAEIVHGTYRSWVILGCPGSFLVFLGGVYAPVGAENDPMGLNRNWVENVALNVAMQLVER